MKAPVVTLLALLAAFVFCVFASTLSGWHSAITRPATAACALGLIACGVWLNRSAGRSGEDDKDRPRYPAECPYPICHHNHPEESS